MPLVLFKVTSNASGVALVIGIRFSTDSNSCFSDRILRRNDFALESNLSETSNSSVNSFSASEIIERKTFIFPRIFFIIGSINIDWRRVFEVPLGCSTTTYKPIAVFLPSSYTHRYLLPAIALKLPSKSKRTVSKGR